MQPIRIALAATGILAASVAHAAHIDVSEHFLPSFDDAVFTGAPPTNTFFPMIDSTTYLYSGSFFDEEEGEDVTESFELTNLSTGPVIGGVQTFAQRDRAFEDDLIVEETFDYYAQDTDGNVWYFGEDVVNFEYDDDDNLIGTNNESAWLAFEDEALPGLIMPNAPTVGFNYWQEFAEANEALDFATIWAMDLVIDLDIGAFIGVLQILEGNVLEPDSREFKYYAPGFGLILVEEALDENFMNPELIVALQGPTSVPEPGSLSLLGMGLGAIVWMRRRVAKR